MKLEKWIKHFEVFLDFFSINAQAIWEDRRNCIKSQCDQRSQRHIEIEKAPGADNILPEVLKSSPDLFIKTVYNLMAEVWNTEETHY